MRPFDEIGLASKTAKIYLPTSCIFANVKRDWNSTTEGPRITQILGLEKKRATQNSR